MTVKTCCMLQMGAQNMHVTSNESTDEFCLKSVDSAGILLSVKVSKLLGS